MAAHAGILQPSYFPWLGFFDQVVKSDVFVLLDTVQYTKNDWRNRNRVRDVNGDVFWLTVPVEYRFRDSINDVFVASGPWRRKHRQSLEACYRKARWWGPVGRLLDDALAPTRTKLVDINIAAIRGCMDLLGVDTRLIIASELPPTSTDKNQRLIDIIKLVRCDSFLEGNAGRAYLDLKLFEESNIAVTFQTYTHPPQFPCVGGGVRAVAGLSILDTLVHCGPLSLYCLLDVQDTRNRMTSDHTLISDLAPEHSEVLLRWLSDKSLRLFSPLASATRDLGGVCRLPDGRPAPSFVIETPEGELLGAVQLHSIDLVNRSACVDVVLARVCVNVIPSAARAVLQLKNTVFGEPLGVSRLEAQVNSQDWASVWIFKAAGFVGEGCCLDGAWHEPSQRFQSLLVLACLASDQSCDLEIPAAFSTLSRSRTRESAAVEFVALDESHLEETLALMNDPSNMHVLCRTTEITPEEHRRWFEGLSGREDSKYFAIMDRSHHVGNVWLRQITAEHKAAQIAIVLSRAARGRKIGQTALRFITEFAFSSGLHRIVAECRRDNPAAVNAFRGAGFLLEAIMPNHRWVGAEAVTMVRLAKVQTNQSNSIWASA